MILFFLAKPPSGGYFVLVMNNFSQITADDEIGFLATIHPEELSEADVDRMAEENQRQLDAARAESARAELRAKALGERVLNFRLRNLR